MKCIFYLWRRSIKNYAVATVKKPGTSIVYLVLIVMVLFSLSVSLKSEMPMVERNVAGYAAVLIGVFLLIGGMSVMNGLKQGTALFSMADVNLLFTAPVQAGKVLISGIAKQASILIFASIAMLAQYPNMRNLAGLDGMALLGLIIAYIAFGVVVNILSASIYAFCAGGEHRRRWVNNVLFGFAAIVLAIFGWFVMREKDVPQALVTVFGSNVWNVVPLIGWGRGLAVAFAEYQFLHAGVFFLLLLLGGYFCVRILRGTDMDYYEDVLLAAERTNQVREDAKTGRISVQGEVGKHVKRDLGEMKGRGASALTHRMFREQSRGSIWILDLHTLGAAAAPLMCMIFIGKEARESAAMWSVFMMSAWLLLFFKLRSPMSRELTYPSLYLIPAGNFRKLIALLLPGIYKSCIDGLVFAGLVLMLLQVSMPNAVIAWLFYISANLIYSAGYLVGERFFGSMRNRVLTVFIYMFMLILFAYPGMIGAMILGADWPSHLAYLACVGWNIAISALIVFLCRNMLSNMELI